MARKKKPAAPPDAAAVPAAEVCHRPSLGRAQHLEHALDAVVVQPSRSLEGFLLARVLLLALLGVGGFVGREPGERAAHERALMAQVSTRDELARGMGGEPRLTAAQQLFDTLPPNGLKIQPLKFENTAWSKKQGGMVSNKTYPDIEGDRVSLSGTKVRDMLKAGERPPAEFTRPEIADILIEWMRSSN